MNDTQNSRSAEQRSARYLMSGGQLHDVPELDSEKISAGRSRIRGLLDRTAKHWELTHAIAAPLVHQAHEDIQR